MVTFFLCLLSFIIGVLVSAVVLMHLLEKRYQSYINQERDILAVLIAKWEQSYKLMQEIQGYLKG